MAPSPSGKAEHVGRDDRQMREIWGGRGMVVANG